LHRIISDGTERSIFERATTAQLGFNRATSTRAHLQVGKRYKRDAVEDRMRRLAQVALLARICALTSVALAFDNGQYDNVSPDVRAWFKAVMAPNGVPCCDIADGHRTDYDFREGAYWVPIEGQWMAVPERAIVRDRGNPVGQAVVWYVHHRGSIIISCFVPADAV
jgi:hypothetical protein